MSTARHVDVDLQRPARKRMLGTVRQLLRDLFEIEVDDLHTNTRFNDDLGMDSLHILALVAEIEEQLAIELELREIADVSTVGQMVDLAVAAVSYGED
jgi:acyl carrier protein